jgi:hypothetical protein
VGNRRVDWQAGDAPNHDSVAGDLGNLVSFARETEPGPWESFRPHSQTEENGTDRGMRRQKGLSHDALRNDREVLRNTYNFKKISLPRAFLTAVLLNAGISLAVGVVGLTLYPRGHCAQTTYS